MKYSLAAFQEPRGMMRILQFIFAICAFATTANFFIEVHSRCGTPPPATDDIETFEYPFVFGKEMCLKKDNATKFQMTADVSSDAQFFVATGVLSFLYCLFIIAVYAFMDELYKSKSEIPLADFMLTTILAIFWLSGSAAWANGTTALKTVTDPVRMLEACNCVSATTTSFSKLNISLILGFLNFFLWASDLWFLYKETIWFQGRQQPPPGITPTI